MAMGPLFLLTALGALALWYCLRWYLLERQRSAGTGARLGWPGLTDFLIGSGANFLDTLGIGSFAPTTAIFKFRGRPSDENIPGTLNVGHALPTLTQALIFI